MQINRISNFEDLNESLSTTGYQLKKDENEAMFYRIEPLSVLSIPQVSETIVVDKMLNFKLFSVASPMVLERKWLLSKKEVNAIKLFKFHRKVCWNEKVTRWSFIRTWVNSIQETWWYTKILRDMHFF